MQHMGYYSVRHTCLLAVVEEEEEPSCRGHTQAAADMEQEGTVEDAVV